MMTQLIQFDSIYSALQEAQTVEEIKLGHDKIEAMKFLARQQKMGFDVEFQIAAARLDHERKGGELLAEGEMNGGVELNGRDFFGGTIAVPPKNVPTLREMGLTKRQSSQWQKEHQVPEPIYRDYLAELKDKKKLPTTNGLLKVAKDLEKKLKRDNLPKIVQSDSKIRIGPFTETMKELDNESVSLIFTDPPYDQESIPLYGLLAEEAMRVLKPGGSLIAYAGHYALPQILTDMSQYLRYWWMLSLKHSGNSARLPGKWVMVGWKPLVWFVKGGRANNEYISDFFEASKQPDKIMHDWQQDTSEAAYYIEYLTEPGELVCDPFVGSGTTLVAAHNLGRRVWGCDIDEEKVAIACSRL